MKFRSRASLDTFLSAQESIIQNITFFIYTYFLSLNSFALKLVVRSVVPVLTPLSLTGLRPSEISLDSIGQYQRNCRPVASYLIFVELTTGKITRFAQTDFAFDICSLTTTKILRNGRDLVCTLQVPITLFMYSGNLNTQ